MARYSDSRHNRVYTTTAAVAVRAAEVTICHCYNMYHGYRCTRKLCAVSTVILCDNNYHGIPTGDPVRYTRGNDTDEGCVPPPPPLDRIFRATDRLHLSSYRLSHADLPRSYARTTGGFTWCKSTAARCHVFTCVTRITLLAGGGVEGRGCMCECVCGCDGAGVLAAWKIGVWVQGEDVSPRHTSPPLQSSSVQSQFVRLEWLTSACACVRVYVSNRLATSFSVTSQTGNTRTRRTIRIFPRHRIRLYILYFLFFYLI